MWTPESLGQYRGIWASIVLSAPDNFRGVNSQVLLDQKQALQDEFDQLRKGFRLAKSKLKAPRMERIAQELIEMSYEAYASGDSKTGAHALQECQGLIWTGSRLKPKYGVEAERRAFGDNVVYAGIRVSPYPYEGTQADVKPEQALLLAAAEKTVHSYLATRRDWKFFALVLNGDGCILRITRDPDDLYAPLGPIQKTFRATYNCLKSMADSGVVKACALIQAVGSVTCYDIEQPDAPRLSARQMLKIKEDATYYFQPMRYHLEDREWFPE